MRTLVTSAFVLTVLMSAITVYFALRSSSLDGEPFATITIDPPDTEMLASATPALAPRKAPEKSDKAVRRTATLPESPNTEPATRNGDNPAVDVKNAGSSTGEADTALVETTRDETGETAPATPRASEATENAATAPDSIGSDAPKPGIPARKATRVSSESGTEIPPATPETLSGPLLLPAESGLGLGVGNMGPLKSGTDTN